MRLADGLHRLDVGVPAYWNALPAELAAMGRSIVDVRAVIARIAG